MLHADFLRVGQSSESFRQYPALAAGLGYAPPSQSVYDRLSDIDAPLRVNTQDGGFSSSPPDGPFFNRRPWPNDGS